MLLVAPDLSARTEQGQVCGVDSRTLHHYAKLYKARAQRSAPLTRSTQAGLQRALSQMAVFTVTVRGGRKRLRLGRKAAERERATYSKVQGHALPQAGSRPAGGWRVSSDGWRDPFLVQPEPRRFLSPAPCWLRC